MCYQILATYFNYSHLSWLMSEAEYSCAKIFSDTCGPQNYLCKILQAFHKPHVGWVLAAVG